MEKEFHMSRNEKNTDLPYGWSKGDTCVMITNKAKKSTCEYIHRRKLRWKVFWRPESYRVIPSSVSVEDVPDTGGCD